MIKTRFTSGKSNKPFEGQWFFTTSPLIRACRLSNEAIYTAIRFRAINHFDSQIICRVKNFNFRTLMAWMKTLSPDEIALLDRFDAPKILVQLDLDNAEDFDAGKLGQWLKFRPGKGISAPGIEYKFRKVKRATSLVANLDRNESAMDGKNREMIEIATAGIEWAQRWKEGVLAGTRDADGDAEENEADLDLWGPQDEYDGEEYEEVFEQMEMVWGH